MYNKGNLQLTQSEDKDCVGYDPDLNTCLSFKHKHIIHDANHSNMPNKEVHAFLPHSDREWVIGGPLQVQQLIMDLAEALIKMNIKPRNK